MKTMIQNLLAAMLVAASLQAFAQGTLVYDQQSATGPVAVLGNGNADGLDIQPSPLTQSFIPTLNAIGFIQFEFADIPNNGNNGATVYVKLWTGSPNPNLATLLGSTTPIYMPNGFANSGLGIAGVTNFYFSTPISLISGQTYYLQPVVLSGDNPWDIITIGNTYPNGQVFEGSAGFNTDFWFREGIVSVPEPTTLAFIGLGCVLFFLCKLRRGFLLAVALCSPIIANASQVYYLQSLGGVGSPPFPVSPYGNSVSVEEVSSGVFLVEDGAPAGSHAQAMHMSDYNPPTPGGTNYDNGTNQDYPPSPYTPIVYTNGLWLEVLNGNTNPVTTNLWLRLHGTVSGGNYQLLSTRNLTYTNWHLGQILFNANDDYTDFLPLPTTNAMRFYRAQYANPVMEIYNGQYALEPNPTNSDAGQVGTFYIYNEGWATNDVTVYYRIGGTAQNGVDYSNLVGEATISNGQTSAEIDIAPIANGLKPDQTIILTLTQNTNYLIDPSYYSATNILYANPEVVPIVRGDNQFPCPNTLLVFNLASDAYDPQGLPLIYSILTWPTHGTLDTNALPYVTYTPTNCYEGTDNFTFAANDGTWTSAPASVTLIISDYVYAYSVSAQTCRGTPVSFALSGGDNCSETLSYALLSNPAFGTLSGTAPNLTYTPTGTNFTGTDSFNYIVYNECGDTATNTVTLTVGDSQLYPNSQTVLTSTNQPIAITLSAQDYDSCNADTNYYTYTVTSGTANGTLSGTPPNLIYTPNHDFEGQDTFNFVVRDGAWVSGATTVTIDVVAGPILFRDCNPFGTAVKLAWILDTNVLAMQQNGLNINDFIVYRSTNPGGVYTSVATNFNGNADWMSYLDTNSAVDQTNYYVVTFEAYDSFGFLNESPFSNEIKASGENPGLLITPTNFWNVVTNLDAPTNVVRMQTPFSSEFTNQYPTLLPFPNTNWPVGTTWSNYTTIFIPSNSVPLSQVTYSIAIDNNYWLYLNNSNAPIESFNHENYAAWSPFKSFESVAPGLLHYGTNSIRVVIQDEGGINYFSMSVSTNDCHGQ